jgi:2-polyprenyl-3-methyl-5-hydroxy-6-metoxy-1,4-benzoquinol methylase
MLNFDSESLRYISGERFSIGADIRFAGSSSTLDGRLEYIASICENKHVLHVGCADHQEVILEKRQKGRWLHELILSRAKRCVGIDVNEAAVKFIQELGYRDVYCADVINDELPPEVSSSTFDLVVLGEMLEHVDNPVAFLSKLRERLGGCAKQMVITVPNALCLTNVLNIRRTTECINTDHRYWFTPFTLAKVVSRAGLTPVSFDFCDPYALPWRERMTWHHFLTRRYPSFRGSIVMVVGFG